MNNCSNSRANICHCAPTGGETDRFFRTEPGSIYPGTERILVCRAKPGTVFQKTGRAIPNCLVSWMGRRLDRMKGLCHLSVRGTFDSVSHRLLLNKLTVSDIRRTAPVGRDFLSYRWFTATVGNGYFVQRSTNSDASQV